MDRSKYRPLENLHIFAKIPLMNRDPIVPNSGGEDDSWESLAEGLFGIDFGETEEAAEIIDPDEPAAVESQEAITPDDAEVSAEVAEVGSTSDDAAELVTESEVAESSSQSADPFDADAQEIEESDVDESDATEAEDDNFWDPLNEWEWEDPKLARPKSDVPAEDATSRGDAKVETTAAASPNTAAPAKDFLRMIDDDDSSAADFREEYIEDPAFGAGVLEDASSPKSDTATTDSAEADAPSDTVAESSTAAVLSAASADESTVTESEAGDAARKRPRRRRRRRRSTGAGQTRDAAETPSSVETPDTDNLISSDETDAGEPDAATDVDKDESESRTRKPRRRPPRRRRRSPASSEAEHKTEEAEPEADTVSDDDMDFDDEEAESSESDDSSDVKDSDRKSPYRNVPTWQEAISYLLKPAAESDSEKRDSKSRAAGSSRSGKSRSSRSRASQPKGESSESSGRRGRRRR